MGNSFQLYVIEMALWVGCIGGLGVITYKILDQIIREDLAESNNIENYQHKYSSIMAIVSSAIFTILVYRISNNFFIEIIISKASNSILAYFSVLILGFIVGYFWMGFATKRYHELNDDTFLSDEEIAEKKFHSKNIFVFMLSVSFFSILMASPSMIDEQIPIVRELFLIIFFGSTVRSLFGSTKGFLWARLKRFFS